MIQHRFVYSVPAAIFATEFGVLPACQPGWNEYGWRRRSIATFAAGTMQRIGSVSRGRVADPRETDTRTA